VGSNNCLPPKKIKEVGMQDEALQAQGHTSLGRLLGKVVVSGTIKCCTGLHIGGPGGELEIGGIDNPVVRDPNSNEPYIPGSSLKGKLRSLLERHLYNQQFNGIKVEFNRSIGKRGKRHECNTAENASVCPICRLFGSTGNTGKKEGGAQEESNNFPSPLIVRDCYLTNADDLKDISSELLYAEWKAENALDRVTAASNPRNMERVPRGAIFDLEIIYAVFDGRQSILKEDLNNLLSTFKMLQLDALGGSGSRGYGKVKIVLSSVSFKKFDNTEEKEKNYIDEVIKAIDLSNFKDNSSC